MFTYCQDNDSKVPGINYKGEMTLKPKKKKKKYF